MKQNKNLTLVLGFSNWEREFKLCGTKGLRQTQQRKALYDRERVERHLNVGDLVMCRIPGLCKKLHDAWEGPFRVESVLSAVNYKVKKVQGKERMKTIHINNAKRYVKQE